MTFLKKANQKYLFYGFIALFLIGCANPVWWYRSPTSDYTHFDFDPTELNCIELTEEVIRVSAIISDIASKLTEQAGIQVMLLLGLKQTTQEQVKTFLASDQLL